MAQRFVLADPWVEDVTSTARIRFCVRDAAQGKAVSYILTVNTGVTDFPDASRYLLHHAVDLIQPACRTLGDKCIELRILREAEAHAALDESIDSLWTFLETLL